MSFKLARFMILVCLLFGRLNALNEPLTSERFVYEEQLLKKVIRMEVWMEQMEREMSQRKSLEQLTLEVENKIAEMSQTHDKMKANLDNLTLATENKIAEMSQTHDKMKTNLDNLTMATENNIAEMSQTHENVKKTLNNLTLETENKIAEMSQTHENVKNTLGNLTLETENKIAEMSQTHDKVTNTLNTLTLDVENKMAELKLVEERVSLPMIAFNAYGLADYSLARNQILIFQNTYLNEDNGYDTVDGVFTAPVGGLYMFSVHACNVAGSVFYYYIVVDNNIIAKSAKYNSAQSDCASVVTLTKLEKDQRVWVKCVHGSPSHQQLYDHDYFQSTFSGVLLHG